MHKFILGENPKSPESGGLWIIHLPDPVAIIEAVYDNERSHSKNVSYSRNYSYKNPDGVNEKW